MKSWNSVVNAPERVEVPKKTTPVPSTKKRGRVETTRKDTALEKRPRKKKSKAPRKSKNMIQPEVERYHMNANDPLSSFQAHYTNETRISKIPDSLVLGNHEASNGVEEISINYTSSRKVYDRSTIIANLCLSIVITENFLNDPDPKTMAEYKKQSNWNKWKEAIEAELNLHNKRKVFIEVIPTPPRTFSVGFKWIFVRKRNENNEVVRYKTRLVAQGFT
jgi:LysM repeat protein